MTDMLTAYSHHKLSRRGFVKAAAVGVMATMSGLLAACETDDDEPDVDPVDDTADTAEVGADADDDFTVPHEGFEPFDAPELDLDTLQAEIPGETLQAERYDHAYVGEVTSDLFIGVSLAGGYAMQSQQDVTAYLCDGDEISIYLTGTLNAQEATLVSDEADVEFSVANGEIAGTVTMAGEDPVTFTAAEATDDAGMYVAGTEIEEVEVTSRWIVLPDGRQRGVPICCVVFPSGGWSCWPCPIER
jgi:hypothetical protein